MTIEIKRINPWSYGAIDKDTGDILVDSLDIINCLKSLAEYLNSLACRKFSEDIKIVLSPETK